MKPSLLLFSFIFILVSCEMYITYPSSYCYSCEMTIIDGINEDMKSTNDDCLLAGIDYPPEDGYDDEIQMYLDSLERRFTYTEEKEVVVREDTAFMDIGNGQRAVVYVNGEVVMNKTYETIIVYRTAKCYLNGKTFN